MKICYFSDRWPWLAKHSGYERLPEYVRKINPDINVFTSKSNLLNKFIGKAYSMYKGWPDRNHNFAASELFFSNYLKKKDFDICHILYYDSHYFFFDRWKKAPKNMVVTIHHPPGRRMTSLMKANLKRISSAIILSTKDMKFYESLIGKERVRFIPHGVDTEFFRPKNNFKKNNIIYAGQNGRNTKMLCRVITRLSKKQPELHFDLLVRKEKRNAEGLRQLQKNPQVSWHETVSDSELLRLYNDSYLLLLPIDTSSANNTILESLACGLPIVTTDFGGIRDYGGNSIYPVVKNNDDNAMIKLIEQYLEDEKLRNRIGKKCRKFAEQKLDWPKVARMHLKAYKEFLE
jgi:glycosyltransferase involved in cell wall biosynthesis